MEGIRIICIYYGPGVIRNFVKLLYIAQNFKVCETESNFMEIRNVTKGKYW